MLPAAGNKGERRNLRGSARLSSKMSGRPPRLRALRPRSRQQRTRTDATRRSEGNLKGAASREEELDAKRCDEEEEKKTEDAGKTTDMEGNAMANEMDVDDDNDDDDEEEEVTMTAITDEANQEATPDDVVDVDIEMRSEEETTEQASYECKSCKPPKMLSDIKAYFEHLRKEHKYKGKNGHNPVENRCPACSYVTLNVKDLENHQRVHHLKRKFFRCAKCDYMTHIRARYTKHVKYHSMPMIKCDACDFSSAYKWNLERHMRNHGGGGAFKCRACNFTADIRQSLTVHESYHHNPPVGHINRKSNNAFERKPRNSPKRYNQVGASDFRASFNKTGSTTTSANSTDSFVSDHSLISLDDKRSALASAECIALKCEEKGCQFITAWDSEMQRHLAECHAPPKPRKPLPRLIPLSLANSKPNNSPIGNSSSGPPTTLLKVPRVRVRPELAQIARDTELAKMYGNKEAANSKRDLNTAAGIFERKNASFFDKLKEKLTTTATSINNNSVPEVAVEGGPTHPSGRRVFKCPHCPFWASTASRFHVHIVGHLNRKPFECSMCAYRSNWRWDITKHIKLKAAKDAVHTTARVLMTDETGRRNYSKYNKYLAQVEQQPWDEDHMEERSIEETNSEELASTKLLIVDNKEYVPTIDLASQSPVTILPSSEANQNGHNVDVSLRPPPALKAAVKSRGQSLLKNNPITIHTTSGGGALSISTATEENKRIQWKCKRCNFRDFNKDTVLLHVKSHYDSTDQEPTEERDPFDCGVCPFSASDAATLSLHKMHHRPNLEAIFKCYLCPYYVSTKAELLEHARLHGEELASIHQQNMMMDSPNSKNKLQQVSISDVGISRTKNETSVEQVIQITSRNNVTTVSKSASGVVPPPPPPPSLLLDTRALPDAPLVWVSRPDGTLTKMLKCRHCPYVSSRRAEVRDHETMHVDTPAHGPLIACTDCSFTCARREIMIAHTEMHAGSLGTVHCLVDETRPDSQQANDLATLLGLTHTPVLGTEPDLHDSRLVHCCGKCPARFLCEKELRIHLRYHTTELAHSCQWCSYAARQSTHLLAHQKAHSSEYQERTKYLLSLYGHSQRYPPPATACVEAAANQESNNSSAPNVAWIVVEINENVNSSAVSTVQRTGGNQVFTCAKCPARYFRLDALEYHMTLHGSNNRFKCNDCDYSSKTTQNLVKHQVVHRRHNEIDDETTATTPSTTLIATSSVSALSVQPPPDPQFGIFMRGNPNFVYQGYLRNGRLKEKRYKCHKCPSAFEKREQYRVHLTLHGAKQRYRCDTCDYSVKYYANFIQHLKKHQANAEAQASRRQFEDDRISVDSDSIADVTVASSSRKSSRSSVVVVSSGNNITNTLQPSNQDKQSLLLMQKKGIISATGEADAETIRCLSCPFSTTDKDVMDAHKRRHGIERMTPSCPHCDYIPRKDENIGEHIRLHFTRLYKPESYLIVELLTLMMEKIPKVNGKEEEKGRQRMKELLFKECADGRFLPLTEPHSLSLGTSTVNKRVIVDPNTGETKNNLAT
ncbi:zinc finger protein 91 isoform X4 [Camponotus floridanus]|uniref:zinc finger protein 91 isoform X4 n=1 Tax=Camponotus floridanus TaxID=104421 RepID=UPI000DC6BBDD|nr:zinc finger protein 91 isoform X4 [Camponotus floridanus]